MVLSVHRNHKAGKDDDDVGLHGLGCRVDILGTKGGWGGRGGGREIIYQSPHCHHQNDLCIKMGRDESRFNVLLIVRDKVTRPCPQTTTFEDKGEPNRIRTEVPLLTSLTPYR